MSVLLSLLRSVVQATGIRTLNKSIAKKGRLCLLTSVAGYDNKRTNYQNHFPNKWVFGDDACFITKTESSYVLGVADGVGGWRTYGVDPGRFSRAVIRNCELLVNSGRFKSDKLDLIISQSYNDVLNSKEPILGSATLCIISLQRNEHRVYTACLGDSGYLVIRDGCVIQRSTHQKHAFNTPFQLACPPTSQCRNFYRDLPNQAVQSSVEVRPGDIIIVGTDGLFDNLTESMILEELRNAHLPSQCTIDCLTDCAKHLVNLAHSAASTPNFLSPFACEARQYGLNIAGGVLGDITVILGVVVIEDQMKLSSGLFQQSHMDSQLQSICSENHTSPLRHNDNNDTTDNINNNNNDNLTNHTRNDFPLFNLSNSSFHKNSRYYRCSASCTDLDK